jgi:hypothetical protein
MMQYGKWRVLCFLYILLKRKENVFKPKYINEERGAALNWASGDDKLSIISKGCHTTRSSLVDLNETLNDKDNDRFPP